MTKHVTSGDVGDAETIGDPGRLGAFSGSRWANEEQPHQDEDSLEPWVPDFGERCREPWVRGLEVLK